MPAIRLFHDILTDWQTYLRRFLPQPHSAKEVNTSASSLGILGADLCVDVRIPDCDRNPSSTSHGQINPEVVAETCAPLNRHAYICTNFFCPDAVSP